MFLPSRGDYGEVFAALYMLFCGDELREKKDRFMRQFEVDLPEWLKQLKMGPHTEDTADKSHEAKKSPERRSDRIKVMKEKTAAEKKPGTFLENTTAEEEPGAFIRDDASCCLNFIQVCRNSFRTHAWFQQPSPSLQFMYDTAVAVYAYQNCPAIDIVFPIKVSQGESVQFHPCLVSVKCWSSMNTAEMNTALTAMKTYVEGYREEGGPTALCILLLIGCQCPGTPPPTVGCFPSHDTYTTVVVPRKDPFGLNEKVIASVLGTEQAEILQSHAFAHVEDHKSYTLLRATSEKVDFVNAILEDRTKA
ncbi:MAG: hypothetical protein SGILL_006570 [Bacillariaceae sp.]